VLASSSLRWFPKVFFRVRSDSAREKPFPRRDPVAIRSRRKRKCDRSQFPCVLRSSFGRRDLQRTKASEWHAYRHELFSLSRKFTLNFIVCPPDVILLTYTLTNFFDFLTPSPCSDFDAQEKQASSRPWPCSIRDCSDLQDLSAIATKSFCRFFSKELWKCGSF